MTPFKALGGERTKVPLDQFCPCRISCGSGEFQPVRLSHLTPSMLDGLSGESLRTNDLIGLKVLLSQVLVSTMTRKTDFSVRLHSLGQRVNSRRRCQP